MCAYLSLCGVRWCAVEKHAFQKKKIIHLLETRTTKRPKCEAATQKYNCL